MCRLKNNFYNYWFILQNTYVWEKTNSEINMHCSEQRIPYQEIGM